MPRTIRTRNAVGLDCVSRKMRSGHVSKSNDDCCCCCVCPDTVDEQLVLFTEQMAQVTSNFFEPFFANPMDVDLTRSYCSINAFFDEQRTIYAARPDVLAQIDFITNAMTVVRKPGSQYFLKSLQYESLAREIETAIQGLLMHIYLLNTRIAILSGYTGEDALAGESGVEIKEIIDPRYAVAKYQPNLSMVSFLYPDVPTGKYYSKLKALLKYSGLYANECEISEDLVRFLDRYIIKYDVNKTLEQWIQEKKAQELAELQNYTDIIEADAARMALLEAWRDRYGDSVLSGTFSLDVRDIDTYLSQVYAKNVEDLGWATVANQQCNPCCPEPATGGMHPWMSPLGRMIPLSGTFSLNPANALCFATDDLSALTGSVEVAEATMAKLYPVLNAPPETQGVCNVVKENGGCPRSYSFPECSVTRKIRASCGTRRTRKNICQ